MFDVLKFLRDYHIDHTTDGERAKRGWVQIECPFCSGSSRGYDLGIKLNGSHGNCWVCRGKSILYIVKTLARLNTDDAKDLITQYSDRTPIVELSSKKRFDPNKICPLPPGTERMQQQHDNYLISRNFDPELLERVYNLKGTGRFGDYKNRIIAPIYFNRQLVSYQGRDITGEKDDRWKACALEEEVICHKEILYGYDLCSREICALVEGASDTWRMGPEAVGVFGLGYKKEQINLLIRRFKRVFIIFDPEPAAQKIAEEIAWQLSMAGREAVIVDLEGDCDPGALKQDDANAIMRELNLHGWNK